MSIDNREQLESAVRGALEHAPDVVTAKRWIRALPGPMLGPTPEGAPAPRGMYFNVLGVVSVRFNKDGSREATFTIATQHDDPNPQVISVRWVPTPGFLTPEQTLAVIGALFG